MDSKIAVRYILYNKTHTVCATKVERIKDLFPLNGQSPVARFLPDSLTASLYFLLLRPTSYDGKTWVNHFPSDLVLSSSLVLGSLLKTKEDVDEWIKILSNYYRQTSLIESILLFKKIWENVKFTSLYSDIWKAVVEVQRQRQD